MMATSSSHHHLPPMQFHHWNGHSTPSYASLASPSNRADAFSPRRPPAGAPASGASSASTAVDTMGISANGTGPSGKKRKRLQRACVACHKAKRRCDGGLPCSNCDFSGRGCAYSDAQGKAVPPTKRTLKPSEMAMAQQSARRQPDLHHAQQEVTHHHQHQHQRPASPNAYSLPPPLPPAHLPSHQHSAYSGADSSATLYSPPTHSARPTSTSPSSRHYEVTSPSTERTGSAGVMVEPTPETRRELLCIFFSQIQPWNCMLDEISFLRDLSSQSVSPALLYAIYAVSARHTFVHSQERPQHGYRSPKLVAVVDEAGNGSMFAREARRVLYREDSMTGLCAVDGEISADTAQALCLLACYEHERQRSERATAYIHAAAKYVSALRDTADDGASSATFEARESALRRQLRYRLVSIIALLDLSLGILSGRGPSLRTWELQAAIQRTRTSRSAARSVVDDDPLTNALSQQLCLAYVLSSAFDTHKRAKAQASSSSSSSSSSVQRSGAQPSLLDTANVGKQVQACETYLQSWADKLTDRLRFDEDNLYSVRQVLLRGEGTTSSGSHSNAGGGDHHTRNGSAWTTSLALWWSGIHLCAEAATLLLQDSVDAELPLAAAQNLAMILERMNVSAFSGPLSALGVAMLRACAAAGENRLRRRFSSASEGSGTTEVRPWTELHHTADMLASESRLSTRALLAASKCLDLGAQQQQGMNAPPARPTARPSWASSPTAAFRSTGGHHAPPALTTVSAWSTQGPGQQSPVQGRVASRSVSSAHSQAPFHTAPTPSLSVSTAGRMSSTSPLQASRSLFDGPRPSPRFSSIDESRKQLPPLLPNRSASNIGLGYDSVSSSSGASSNSTSATTTLPPIRFPSPSEQSNRGSWKSGSSGKGDGTSNGHFSRA